MKLCWLLYSPFCCGVSAVIWIIISDHNLRQEMWVLNCSKIACLVNRGSRCGYILMMVIGWGCGFGIILSIVLVHHRVYPLATWIWFRFTLAARYRCGLPLLLLYCYCCSFCFLLFLDDLMFFVLNSFLKARFFSNFIPICWTSSRTQLIHLIR